jgi:ABC-type branched-subunit amino acid transport system ATPase component
LISSFYAPVQGEVFFAGKAITGKNPYRITRAGIARTFQGTRVFEKRSILDNIQVAEGRELFSALTVFENLMMGAYRLRDPKKIEENLKSVFDLFPVLAERK